MNIEILELTYPEAKAVTQEDVWGKWSKDYDTKIHNGLIIADCRIGGYDDEKLQSKVKCPVFKDFIGWKSVTVVCDKAISEEVAYWLEYVQGSDCISQVKDLEDDKIALRADYTAW